LLQHSSLNVSPYVLEITGEILKDSGRQILLAGLLMFWALFVLSGQKRTRRFGSFICSRSHEKGWGGTYTVGCGRRNCS